MYPLFVPELLIIAFIFILLFGAKKVPELMKGMGEGIRGLKAGIAEDPKEEED
jgi:sec-independent protein translocase protein TatA